MVISIEKHKIVRDIFSTRVDECGNRNECLNTGHWKIFFKESDFIETSNKKENELLSEEEFL